jgi:hypothetical protein
LMQPLSGLFFPWAYGTMNQVTKGAAWAFGGPANSPSG